jgi:hypothetical protein
MVRAGVACTVRIVADIDRDAAAAVANFLNVTARTIF